MTAFVMVSIIHNIIILTRIRTYTCMHTHTNTSIHV